MRITISQKMKIPFISAFYDFITDDKSESFSFANAISLLVSVPVTIIYKLANNGDAPFKNGSHGFDQEEMFDLLLENSMKNEPLHKNEKEPDMDDFFYYYPKYGGLIGSIASFFSSGFDLIIKITPENQTNQLWYRACQAVSYAGTFPIRPSTESGRNAFGFRLVQYLESMLSTYGLTREKGTESVSLLFSILLLGLNLTANIKDNPGALSWFGHMISRAGGIGGNIGNVVKKEDVVVICTGVSLLGSLFGLIKACTSDYGEIIHYSTFVD